MELSSKTRVPKTTGGEVQTMTVEELKKQGLQKGANLLTDAQGYDSKNFVKMENIQNQFKDDTVIQRRQGYGYSQVNHNYATNLDNTNNSSDGGTKNEPINQNTQNIKNRMENNVRVTMPSRKRLDTAIALYMPAQVQVTYGAKYETPEISALAGALGQAIGDMSQGMSLSDTYNKVIPMVTEGLQKKALLMGADLLDGIGISGAREAVEIGRAEVIADRIQLAFKGVDRRAFQYSFKMIPRNSREADEIRKIVFAFKSNMLPELIGGKDRDTMRVPNTFNIQYMYQGKENDFIHRVSECFLENVQVSYGGDRYKTFEPHDDSGAPPVETSITLAFKEIEIMTKERIFEGY